MKALSIVAGLGVLLWAAAAPVLAQEAENAAPTLEAAASRAAGSELIFRSYAGANHGSDDSGRRRQSVRANAEATRAVRERAGAFFAQALAPR